MLVSFEEAGRLIAGGKALHIAGSENLIKKLPKGNWIGGSTEMFMAKGGGTISGDLLFVNEFSYGEFNIKTYSASDIDNVAADAYDNGFSIIIIPFDSAVHKKYAQYAPGFKDIFLKNVVGWVSGVNPNVPGQVPTVVCGTTGAVSNDSVVALHLKVPDTQRVSVGIVNIFSQDESSPVITFPKEGFSATTCFIDGKETNFAEYIAKNNIDTRLPLVVDYAGYNINTSFKGIVDNVVYFYSPVFEGIQYKMSKNVGSYEKEFNDRLALLKDANAVFSCNCLLNFFHGELEGKDIATFTGPITFGEVAYQLLSQTLVYLTVSDA